MLTECITLIFVATDHAGLSRTINSKELVVDTSPPTLGTIVVDGIQKIPVYINAVHIDLYLTDFADLESGIDFYEVCLGTQEMTCDLVDMQSFRSERIHYQLPQIVHDGHAYIINARVNKYLCKYLYKLCLTFSGKYYTELPT